MQVRFAVRRLARLYSDPGYTAGFGKDVVRAFRKRVQLIRAARDQRDLRALKSLHFEKLKGRRPDQWSMRLVHQWRLIVRLTRDEGGTVVAIMGIEDYH